MLSNILSLVKKEKRYEEEFKKALKRTKSWKLEVPQIVNNESVITENKCQQLYNLVQDKLIKLNLDYIDICNNCFLIHNILKDDLEKALGVHFIYTLGYVTGKEGAVFYTPSRELYKILQSNNQTNTFNLHTWLTNPNYEIIDFTFYTTMGIITNNQDLLGSIIFQHYTKFTEDMQYHPQLLGNDFIQKAGIMKEVIDFSI